MTFALLFLLAFAVLALASYADRVYSEMGKFLAREYQENLDAWTRYVEPAIKLSRDNIALSAWALRGTSIGVLGMLFGQQLLRKGLRFGSVLETLAELIFVILLCDRLIPEMFFARTTGMWAARLRFLYLLLFYVALPVTLGTSLLLSIASLAEPDEEKAPEATEAVDALLEAGQEEGILEESDRALVRSVVEFGDKVVREVMTPRPQMFAVPDNMTVATFTDLLKEHNFSRVPVFSGTVDNITGIAFAHDILQIPDSEASRKTLRDIQRHAVFVPEPKKVNELLREMQRAKQHMSVVIDEYGAVAGIVTIEDLIEAIVGSIADEHETGPEATDEPIREQSGVYALPGDFEVSRLRDLLSEETTAQAEAEEVVEIPELRLPADYEATTVGGLISEIAGHIPQAGEVVEAEGLRLEVLASTARRVNRVRVSLLPPSQPE